MRDFAIALLDDEHGIRMAAWKFLRDVLIEEGGHEGGNDDILDAVKCTEGRVYLPESWDASDECVVDSDECLKNNEGDAETDNENS